MQALPSSQSAVVVHALTVAACATSTASRLSIAARAHAPRADLVLLICPLPSLCVAELSRASRRRRSAPPCSRDMPPGARRACRPANGAGSTRALACTGAPYLGKTSVVATTTADDAAAGAVASAAASGWRHAARPFTPHGECVGGDGSIRRWERARAGLRARTRRDPARTRWRCRPFVPGPIAPEPTFDLAGMPLTPADTVRAGPVRCDELALSNSF